MNDFFAAFESVIKRIFEILAGIFKIFDKKEEEGTETEGNA